MVDDGEPSPASPVLHMPVRLVSLNGEEDYISDSVRLIIPVSTCLIS